MNPNDFPLNDGDRVVSMAFLVATDSGDREVLGFDVGLNKAAGFWTPSLRDWGRPQGTVGHQ